MPAAGLPRSSPVSPPWSPATRNAVLAALLCLAIALYGIAFGLLLQNGYGENLDNYLMLRAWQMMAGRGVYVPSRYQGNVPSELGLGYLAGWFGPLGANGLSLVLSLVALATCYVLFGEVSADPLAKLLAVLTIAANPFWVNAAVTSMDYLHPLALFLVGVLCLRRRLPVVGAMLLAVAAGCRLSYAPLGVAALALAVALWRDPEDRRVGLQAVLVFFAITALIFLPVFIFSHLSFAFVTSARPDWQGLAGLLARGAYKQLYLYGLPATALLAIAVLWGGIRHLRNPGSGVVWPPATRLFAWICIAALIYHTLLFFYIPIRIEYLLPSLVAVAGLLLVVRARAALVGGLVVLELLYWVVSLDLIQVDHRYADPCASVQAVAARVEPHVVEGVLLPRFRHDTIEATCLPQRLVQQPANVHDRLPRPAPVDDPATALP